MHALTVEWLCTWFYRPITLQNCLLSFSLVLRQYKIMPFELPRFIWSDIAACCTIFACIGHSMFFEDPRKHAVMSWCIDECRNVVLSCVLRAGAPHRVLHSKCGILSTSQPATQATQQLCRGGELDALRTRAMSGYTVQYILWRHLPIVCEDIRHEFRPKLRFEFARILHVALRDALQTPVDWLLYPVGRKLTLIDSDRTRNPTNSVALQSARLHHG